jgi:hypothetical protein
MCVCAVRTSSVMQVVRREPPNGNHILQNELHGRGTWHLEMLSKFN